MLSFLLALLVGSPVFAQGNVFFDEGPAQAAQGQPVVRGQIVIESAPQQGQMAPPAFRQQQVVPAPQMVPAQQMAPAPQVVQQQAPNDPQRYQVLPRPETMVPPSFGSNPQQGGFPRQFGAPPGYDLPQAPNYLARDPRLTQQDEAPYQFDPVERRAAPPYLPSAPGHTYMAPPVPLPAAPALGQRCQTPGGPAIDMDAPGYVGQACGYQLNRQSGYGTIIQ